MEDYRLLRSVRPNRATAVLLTVVLAATLNMACGAGTKVNPEPDPGAHFTPGQGVVNTPPPGALTVAVILREWAVEPERPAIAAGKVYFLATNAGGKAHEMVVIRTDLAANALPEEDGRVPENKMDVAGAIEPFSPGSKASTVLDLKPGKYVLICNMVETVNGERLSHYLQGMRTAFTVHRMPSLRR